MNSEVILASIHRYKVDAILIGGMNFLLRHRPVLTFDIDLWVRDDDANLFLVTQALRELDAEWGKTESSWGPVPDAPAWLRGQSIFCLTTPFGAVDIFREVRGLEGQFDACRARALSSLTPNGTPYLGLSDQDMLTCQLVLPESERRLDRVAFLKNYLESKS